MSSTPKVYDEYGYIGDLSSVKIPPQVKGKLEYHSTPNTPKIDEIIKENFYDYHENCDDSCGKKADYTEFKNDLYQLILEVIGIVEPCEPDCSPERHAYHQGQWDLHIGQENRLNNLFGKDK